MNNEAPYWMAIAHLPRWGSKKINSLIVNFFHNQKLGIVDFFDLKESDWAVFGLGKKDIEDLQIAKKEIPSNAFLAEKLQNEGIELIPITSNQYSDTLKENLKTSFAPPILYIKGNKRMLKKNSLAIVGSRNATDVSLSFADSIAKAATQEYKVVVSGFAKGVDKQALDSTLKYKGQSIVVLPQGILTFNSGFKKYYSQIVAGDVLVISTFQPRVPWQVELAMARNSIIYGLAKEIYVAESNEKGGTWSGVIDGLKKSRKIYVRIPNHDEKNANLILIQKGAIGIEYSAVPYEVDIIPHTNGEREKNASSETASTLSINEKIVSVFNGRPLSAKEIITKAQLNWNSRKLTKYLSMLDYIQIVKKGRSNYYVLKSRDVSEQKSLFP